MANYSVYNPNQASVEASGQWREDAYLRLQQLGAQRQAWTDKMYAEQQAAAKKAEEQALNSMYGTAAKGAMTGAMFGPQGAAVGGGVGLALGAVGEYGARRDAGDSKWEAFKHMLRAPSVQEIGVAGNAAMTMAPMIAADQRQQKLDAKLLQQRGGGYRGGGQLGPEGGDFSGVNMPQAFSDGTMPQGVNFPNELGIASTPGDYYTPEERASITNQFGYGIG